MNKKVLLSTLLASGIVATSLLTGNAKAATNIENYGEKVMTAVQKVEQTETQKSDYIMSVLLESSNPLGGNKNILTRKQVEDLLNEKYGKIGTKSVLSKVYGKDGSTEIKGENDPVGTGYTVELATGRTMKVVLYGDVNKDGMIDTDDTVEIAKHNVHTATLDDYQKLAAQLKVKGEDSEETTDGINTDDTVRVAYYNVNGLTTDKTGKAIVDMELYPDDVKEEVNIDTILQNTIKDINEKTGNEEKFSMSLNESTNSIQFGFLNDVDVSLSTLAGTDIMTKLADNLGTFKDNLEKIELSVEDKTVELSAEMSSEECLYKIAQLFTEDIKLPEDMSDPDKIPTVASILGKEVKIKFYIYQTTSLLNEENKTVTDKGYSVEYTTSLVADAEKDVQNIIEFLQSYETEGKNQWFTTTMEDHAIKVSVKGEKATAKILTDIKGKGNTGIFVALDQFLKSPYITDFGNVTLSIPNSDASDSEDTGILNSMTFTFEKLRDALKAVKENNASVDEEYRDTIKDGILFMNTLLGKSSDYVSSVKALLDAAKADGNYTNALLAELGILSDLELGDLKDKKIELKFELEEGLIEKTNWTEAQTYTLEFEVEAAKISNQEDLTKVLADKNVDEIILEQDISEVQPLTINRSVTIEGAEGADVTLKGNVKVDADNVKIKNLTIEDPDYSATAGVMLASNSSEEEVMVISNKGVTIENVTFKHLKTSDTSEKGENGQSIITVEANADNVTIKDCTFEGNEETNTNGIFRNIILVKKDAGSNITITGNTFKQLKNIYNGIEFAFDYQVKKGNNIVIENNTFTGDIKHNSLSMYSFESGSTIELNNNTFAGVRFSNVNGGDATINFNGGQIIVGEESHGPVTFQRTSENDNIKKLTVNVKELKDKSGDLFSEENDKFAGFFDNTKDVDTFDDQNKPTIKYVS